MSYLASLKANKKINTSNWLNKPIKTSKQPTNMSETRPICIISLLRFLCKHLAQTKSNTWFDKFQMYTSMYPLPYSLWWLLATSSCCGNRSNKRVNKCTEMMFNNDNKYPHWIQIVNVNNDRNNDEIHKIIKL